MIAMSESASWLLLLVPLWLLVGFVLFMRRKIKLGNPSGEQANVRVTSERWTWRQFAAGAAVFLAAYAVVDTFWHLTSGNDMPIWMFMLTAFLVGLTTPFLPPFRTQSHRDGGS